MKILPLLFLLFTGHYLFAQQPKLVLPVGHTGSIEIVQFSPDGKRIATGSRDKTVKIWDVRTGKLLADLKGHSDAIKSLQYNSLGNRLLTTALLDSNVKLWDAETGLLIKDLTTGIKLIDFAIFSPDGKMIMMTSKRREQVILSAETGLPLVILKGCKDNIESADFSPDSKIVVTNSGYEAPEVWDTQTGKLLSTLDGHAHKIVKFLPDGRRIVTTNLDNTIRIWDSNTGKMLFDLKGNNVYITSLTLSPDGQRMTSSTLLSNTTKLWDLNDGKFITDLTVNDAVKVSVSFSPDSKTILTTGWETKIWDSNRGELKNTIPFHGISAKYHKSKDDYIIHSSQGLKIIDGKSNKTISILDSTAGFTLELFAVFSEDGDKVICYKYGSETASIWDIKTGELLVELKGKTNSFDNVYSTPDSKYIITESYKNTLIWDIEKNMSPLKKDINDSIELLRFSPDGEVIVKLKANYGEVSLWNAQSLECINPNLEAREMQHINTDESGSFVFSSDSKKLFLTNNSNAAYIMDAKSGEMQSEIKTETVWSSTINPSGTIYISYFNNEVKVVDLKTGKQISKFNIDLINFKQPFEFIDDEHFITFSSDNSKLFSVFSGKPVLTMPNGQVAFNSNRSRLMIYSYDGLRVWDLKKAKLQLELNPDKTQYENFGNAFWSFDEKQILYSSSSEIGNRILVIDANTGLRIKEINGYAQKIIWNKSGEYVFFVNEEVVSIYDSKTFQLVSELKAHSNKVNSVISLYDETKILTISEDNTAKIWELNTGKLLYTCLLLNNDYIFNIIPSGYYIADQNAAKLLHYVTNDLKVITFEQLDVKYNRPDKVLEAIGSTDTTLINSYKKAYFKRLKKLEIDTTSFEEGYSVPESDFKNRDDIEYEQKNEELKLVIKGVDSTYKLDRFNIWINEIPLYGKRGISIRNRKSNQLDTTITVQLSQGENRIETSIMNVNGTESYRMPLYVKFTSTNPVKEKVHFIGIGIDKFADSTYNLRYSVKDIRDLAKKLREKYGNSIEIDTLLNQQVTVDAIKSLKKKLLTTSVNDKVIISYSGHGMLSKDFDYYLSTYSVNFNHPEENGLSYDDLESLLDSIPARNKLLLIDACHSGEVDKEDLMAMKESSDSLIKGARIYAYKEDEKHLGLKNSFELMQNLFVNVGKSTGATIISAAAGTQFALERNDLKNGVFTYCILDAMNNYPTMKVSELKKTVGEQVEKITKGLQKPTSRNETINSDWKVW